MAKTCYPRWTRGVGQKIRVGETILQACIWEAVGFKRVTSNHFSSGVPDTCEILGNAGSNPLPSDCRWASGPNQTKSEKAGRCSSLCFLWCHNLCWSGIKQQLSFIIIHCELLGAVCTYSKNTQLHQLINSHNIITGLLNSDNNQWAYFLTWNS